MLKTKYNKNIAVNVSSSKKFFISPQKKDVLVQNYPKEMPVAQLGPV
jgi:hypothetical protein